MLYMHFGAALDAAVFYGVGAAVIGIILSAPTGSPKKSLAGLAAMGICLVLRIYFSGEKENIG